MTRDKVPRAHSSVYMGSLKHSESLNLAYEDTTSPIDAQVDTEEEEERPSVEVIPYDPPFGSYSVQRL